MVQALLEPVPNESDLSDNTKKIVFVTGYQGDVSKLPETNYLAVLVALVIVLFVVRKK